MKLHLLVPSLIALCLAGGSAHAQIKLPIFDGGGDNLKNVVFTDVSKASDFQHGRLVRVTVKGSDKPVQGILVRVDGKTERIFVRTQPGTVPRAFDAKDITKVEKGTIKQVNFAQDVTRPEIQPMEIVNGQRRTISYAASTLSPSELSILRDLEASENALQNMEVLATRAQMAQDIELGIQAEHLRTQKLQNELLWQNIYSFYRPRYMPWFAPVTANTSSVQAGGAAVATASATADALAKARQNVASSQHRLVYEGSTLVAVIPDESK